MVQIFLAHASEDKDAVTDLYNRLKERGFQPWMDKKDLRAGQNWRAEIPKVIRNSQVFIACLSKQSVAKQSYVQREFRMALQEMANKPPGQIYLIPLRLDDCKIPDLRQEESGISLRDYHWANLFEPNGLEQLVKDIEYGFADVLNSSSSASTSDASANSEVSENPSYEEVLERLKQLEDKAKTQSSPKYDLRGAQFAGGFAETVLGGQVGGTINNEPSDPSKPDVPQPTAPPRQQATPSLEAQVRKNKPQETVDKSPKTIDLGNGITLELAHIPGGNFLMGSPRGEGMGSERPQHQVTVPEFWMGKYPVTQAQYAVVIGKRPSKFLRTKNPVEMVSWHNAVAFCEKVSQKTEADFRLPSEAEWEYACRAGTATPYSFGQSLTKEQANFNQNMGKTTPVGQYPPNEFGLYDMHGNVWEWCQDHWHDNYNGAPSNGGVWIEGSYPEKRVIRGGSWDSFPRFCRSAFRYDSLPGERHYTFGFRVACSAPRPPH